MRVCALVKIIKDGASGTGPHAAAWKEGDNMLIALRNLVTAGTQLTLTLLHLAELPPEDLTTKLYKAKIETVEDEDEDIDKDHALLRQHIAKKQRVLAMLQKTPQGSPTQTNRGGRGGYQGRGRQCGSQRGCSGGWREGRGGGRGGGTGSGSF
eukprot:2644817-Rhodomonas_salina.1